MRFVYLIIVLTIFFSCGSSLPEATKSEYFKTTGAGFFYDKSINAFKYNLVLQPTKQIDTTFSLQISFENPNSKDPSILNIKNIDVNKLSFQSDKINEPQNGETYKIIVGLFLNGKPISKHIQKVYFYMPEQLLKAMKQQ